MIDGWSFNTKITSEMYFNIIIASLQVPDTFFVVKVEQRSQKAETKGLVCTAETLTGTARQNLFLPIYSRNYEICIL